MQKLLLLCLVIVAFSANAQIDKNATLVGGQFSIGSSSNQSNNSAEFKNNSQRINLFAGKAFKENKVWGIKTGYLHWKTYYPGYRDTASSQNHTITAGLFFRQYKKLVNKLYVFGQADGYYSFANIKSKDRYAQVSSQSNSHAITFAVTPGLSYQLFKRLQAEITLPNVLAVYYNTTKSTRANDPGYLMKNKSYGISTSLSNISSLGQLGIGFSLVL